MRNWEELAYTDTFGSAVDKFNSNSENSDFMDKITGKILCNSVIFNGKETIDNELVLPFKNIKSSGLVESNTIFDNFVLYFRNENKIIELNNFPIDLLAFADNKIHFLFIKSDYTYRVSDTIFGRVDELLLGRFIITSNSQWSEFYITAQMAGTPMYDGADEFYETNGLIIKSPSGLHLSFTGGNIKRSGIKYTDFKSPNTKEYDNYYDENINIPIRYVNTYNEVDYSTQAGDSVITNRYMIYNNTAKLKAKCEDLIDNILSSCYKLEEKTNERADDLQRAVNLGLETDNDFKNRIILDVLNNYSIIFNDYLVKLKNYLDEQELSSIDSSDITTIKTNIDTFINTNLYDVQDIQSPQVEYLRDLYSFIDNRDESVCNKPLYTILNTLLNDLSNLTIEAGTISPVANNKYTIQRILFDIYTNCFIIQYGDTVYDTYDDAIAATELQEYPAPWNKTVYIPMAIIILKSGITSIKDDEETLILSKRGVNVDEPQEESTDFFARLKIRRLSEDFETFKTEISGDLDDFSEEINTRLDDFEDEVGQKLINYTSDFEILTYSGTPSSGGGNQTSILINCTPTNGKDLSGQRVSLEGNYYPLGVVGEYPDLQHLPARMNYFGVYDGTTIESKETNLVKCRIYQHGASAEPAAHGVTVYINVLWIKIR